MPRLEPGPRHAPPPARCPCGVRPAGPAPPAARLVESSLGPMPVAPGRDRVCEHVVIDLVASRRAVLRTGADDPLRSEAPQDVGGFVLADVCIAGEVTDAVRDLRPRRRDEE